MFFFFAICIGIRPLLPDTIRGALSAPVADRHWAPNSSGAPRERVGAMSSWSSNALRIRKPGRRESVAHVHDLDHNESRKRAGVALTQTARHTCSLLSFLWYVEVMQMGHGFAVYPRCAGHTDTCHKDHPGLGSRSIFYPQSLVGNTLIFGVDGRNTGDSRTVYQV